MTKDGTKREEINKRRKRSARSGPRTEPWGTPEVTGEEWEQKVFD